MGLVHHPIVNTSVKLSQSSFFVNGNLDPQLSNSFLSTSPPSINKFPLKKYSQKKLSFYSNSLLSKAFYCLNTKKNKLRYKRTHSVLF